PNIGVDYRNQFDMMKSLPGYPDAVTDMITQFNEQGVRVMIPYNPWDLGTRENEIDDADQINQIMIGIGAAGFNGDTMSGIPADFFYASQNQSTPSPFLLNQPEVGLNDNCSNLETN